MEWPQQFEILHKIIAQRLSEIGKKPTTKNVADYLGIPPHKYQAWKDGQRPVVDDLKRLAQEFEFNPDWLLIGKGRPVQPRKDAPFDPKYVEICDTLHELVRALPDKLPKIAEIGGMSTTDLYNCIHTQEFPPAEAVAKWVIHYRINANFLLAQIGQPFLTDEEYNADGPLNFVRERRGDFMGLEDEEEESSLLKIKELQAKLDASRERSEMLAVEITRQNEQIRALQAQWPQKKKGP